MMRRFQLRISLAAVFLLAAMAVAVPLRAQFRADSTPVRTSRAPLLQLSGPRAEWQRVLQLRGKASADNWLLRSASSIAPVADDSTSLSEPRYHVIDPVGELSWNSALPGTLDRGAYWSGRGSSLWITGGAELRAGRLIIRAIPEISYTQNRSFPILRGDPVRHSYSSPWHSGTWSADLPLRFGSEPITRLSPGQSMIGVVAGPVQFGASTEDQWWGPGVRNALVLSDNAGWIPHLFLRTARPLRSALGDVEARWITGVLTESLYFDEDTENDLRSLSGVVATLRPRGVPDLTVGVARTVYAEVSGAFPAMGHGADALFRWNRLGEAPDSGERGVDHLMSVFGRWIFPAAGAEVYGEWARMQTPRSLRELLVAPQRSQGWTAGLLWTHERSHGIVTAQAEVTTLEQTPSDRDPFQSFYTSRAVPQGYTQRGQVLGAAIGPGASSQWLAIDYFASRWRAGAFTTRVRWENDVYYRQVTGVAYFAHDVSTHVGLRGGATAWGVDVDLEIARELRRNYLFQNVDYGYGADPSFDVRNTALRLRVAPTRWRR
jgi:hypothetical protein